MESYFKSYVSCHKCWNFLPRMSHYGAILFTLSVVNSDVSKLTWQWTGYVFPEKVEAVGKETQETWNEQNQENCND
jgi:hypothetical protein